MSGMEKKTQNVFASVCQFVERNSSRDIVVITECRHCCHGNITYLPLSTPPATQVPGMCVS